MLPFGRDAFLEVFAAYNGATWPVAVLTYPMAAFALVVTVRGEAGKGGGVAIVLAAMWAWAGLVYHGLYFSRINPAAYAFAGAFLLQALLFSTCAVRGRALTPGRPEGLRLAAGGAMAAYALIAYPLIGLAGEGYPHLPLFGTAPCPLLILTFAILTLLRRAAWWLWIVPLAWTAIGGSASVLLSVPQDWGLPASAVTAVSLALAGRRNAPQ